MSPSAHPQRPPAVRELAEAIRLTREYVGADVLPAVEGWSWYDALSRWAPEHLPQGREDTVTAKVESEPSEPHEGYPEPAPELSDVGLLRADTESQRYMIERARWALGTDDPIPSNVARPPAAVYEVRTVSGITYRAEGDVIEQGDGWFTLWADKMVIALRLPEVDIRSIRAVVDAWEDENPPPPDACRPGCCIDNDSLAPTTCAFCGSSEACINHPGQEALARGAAGHPFSPSGQGEESSAGSDSPALADLVRDALGIDVTNPGVGETPDWSTILTTACRELLKSEAARTKLRTQGNIQGRCPACHGQSLFLGDGGYVTCARLDCQDPDAASVVLENRPRPAGGR